jgi:cytoskeletal protein RodZ
LDTRLKEKRVSLGIEIGDISEITRINLRYLRAIEEGEFNRLPGDIYSRGYIREYARCLGVPFPDAISEYEIYLEKERGPENSHPPVAKKMTFLRRLNCFFMHREKWA